MGAVDQRGHQMGTERDVRAHVRTILEKLILQIRAKRSAVGLRHLIARLEERGRAVRWEQRLLRRWYWDAESAPASYKSQFPRNALLGFCLPYEGTLEREGFAWADLAHANTGTAPRHVRRGATFRPN
jgi:hypothetical protein